MRLRGLRLSLGILLFAVLLAGGLVSFVLQQQNEALDAADAVVMALETRSQLRQLKVAIERGPSGWVEVDTLIERLRNPGRGAEHAGLPQPTIDALAMHYGSDPLRALGIVEAEIHLQSQLVAERRGSLADESHQARLALVLGSSLVMSLLFLAFAIVVRDNRRRRAAERELRGTNEDLEARVAARTAQQQLAEERLRELSRKLLQVQEAERRSLARELHDEVGQQLGAIKLNLKAMARRADAASQRRIDDCLGVVEQTITRIRDRALDLRPALLDDLGLSAALDWLCQQQAQRSGVEVRLSVPPLPTFGAELATTAYRVVQEALTNALKHAAARRIDVTLSIADDLLHIVISDDGLGFITQQASAGIGLPGMRERVAVQGGRVNIVSAPNYGTTIRVELPLLVDEPQTDPAAG